MGQWEKLYAEILQKSPSLRFADLRNALLRIGYSERQPTGGSSHYTFRKPGNPSITIPKHKATKKVYVSMVSDAVRMYLDESAEAEEENP